MLRLEMKFRMHETTPKRQKEMEVESHIFPYATIYPLDDIAGCGLHSFFGELGPYSNQIAS